VSELSTSSPEINNPEPASLDTKRQKKAQQYARIQRRFLLADMLLGLLLLVLWLGLGWSASLRDWIQVWTDNPWLAVAVFGGIFGGIFYVIDLPLSFYTSYILPHRFEQSTQSLRGWITDQFKNLLVSLILGGLVLEVIYFLLRATPERWWLWAGAFLLVFNILLANLAPILIFPLFYKFIPLSAEHQDLKHRLLNLAKKAGAAVQGVYTIDLSKRTKSANAALTGLGNTRRILLGDTLISEFSPDEIETVLAHELGHHTHHDIPLGIVVQTLTTFGGLYLADLVLQSGVELFGFQSAADLAALPLFGLAIGLFGLLTMPLGNAYSRWRERMADRFALDLTGKNTAYASALTRLANQNLAEVNPEPWVEFLLFSHPALGKRILMAEQHNQR
jgi:STE24 endopeptidase